MSERDRLEMWTVYDHPLDHPEHFVARRWVIEAEGPRATGTLYKSAELERIRAAMRAFGLVKLDRDPADDPKIVEVWL